MRFSGSPSVNFGYPRDNYISLMDFNGAVKKVPLLYTGDRLNTGSFYFIKDEYYKRFSNCGLMGNKGSDEAGVHGIPCCYCFETDGYFWMVPISSKTEKYKKIYEGKKRDIKNMMVCDLAM